MFRSQNIKPLTQFARIQLDTNVCFTKADFAFVLILRTLFCFWSSNVDKRPLYIHLHLYWRSTRFCFSSVIVVEIFLQTLAMKTDVWYFYVHVYAIFGAYYTTFVANDLFLLVYFNYTSGQAQALLLRYKNLTKKYSVNQRKILYIALLYRYALTNTIILELTHRQNKKIIHIIDNSK